jgi:hypothetical protein
MVKEKVAMSTTYQEVLNQVLNQVQHLEPDDQLRLLEELEALVYQRVLTSEEPLHSFLELEGLGQEVWEGVDAQEYVNQERASWNGYPRYEGKQLE